MIKVAFGIPAYSTQDKDFWVPLIHQASTLYKYDIELERVIAIGSMATDYTRNAIVESFLESKAEWLFWIDSDNAIVTGQLPRMLDTRESLVTGVYVKKYGDKPEPVVYLRKNDNSYHPLTDYRVGEIIPVDAAGMGGCLSHRSVFEDIKKNYRIFQRFEGGLVTIHKDDIVGDFNSEIRSEDDSKVVNGAYHERLTYPVGKNDFPYFMLHYIRTEDYDFFEKAKRVGHQLWCDTSCELGHIGSKVVKVGAWRAYQKGKK